MNRSIRGAAGAGAALLLSACGLHQIGGTSFIKDTAEHRVVTSTPVTVLTPGRVTPSEVICSEPSPDVAKLMSDNLSFETKIAANIGNGIEPSVALAFARARSEAVVQLGKRLATIQLLRDGTFRACEAYRNGAISDTTYAVIVAHTERVMVALLSAELVSGDNSTPPAPFALAAPPLGRQEALNLQQDLAEAQKSGDAVHAAEDEVRKVLPGGLDLARVGDLSQLKPLQQTAVQRLLDATRKRSAAVDRISTSTLPRLQEVAKMLTEGLPASAPKPAAKAVPRSPAPAPAPSTTPPAPTPEAVQLARIAALERMQAFALAYPSLSSIEVACINTLDRPFSQPVKSDGSSTTLLQDYCDREKVLNKLLDHKIKLQYDMLPLLAQALGGAASPAPTKPSPKAKPGPH